MKLATREPFRLIFLNLDSTDGVVNCTSLLTQAERCAAFNRIFVRRLRRFSQIFQNDFITGLT
jgi:hypothetical protein